VLTAYSLIDVEIAYTQGMNFIVATIICTLIHYGSKDDYLVESNEHKNMADLEEKSLTIFKFMMEKTGFRKIMLVERGHIAEICFKLAEKLKVLN
jgi:hypothetical protein